MAKLKRQARTTGIALPFAKHGSDPGITCFVPFNVVLFHDTYGPFFCIQQKNSFQSSSKKYLVKLEDLQKKRKQTNVSTEQKKTSILVSLQGFQELKTIDIM